MSKLEDLKREKDDLEFDILNEDLFNEEWIFDFDKTWKEQELWELEETIKKEEERIKREEEEEGWGY